jgi:RHH-type proline utilization regulon transcriptional repressor/proline dehydrogenase/delta 1-pyrroline-5-carboxylate dehydrogenase
MKMTEQFHGRLEPLDSVSDRYLADEQTLVRKLADTVGAGASLRDKIRATAELLVRDVRENAGADGGLDAFLQQYDLSSEEGVLLMCIAEALLRIPDADTADELIADKITSARWQDHLGESDSLFVNASTWGLMLTGRLLKLDEATRRNPVQVLKKLASRAGEPVVRTAMRQAMRIMGHQFVMGRTIDEALERSQRRNGKRYRYSFDMLGEAALTRKDAARYLESYSSAIRSIGVAAKNVADVSAAPSISIKLSALHPRYTFSQAERVLDELTPLVGALAIEARNAGIALTVDAEEADRLELSLDIFERVYRDERLAGYAGFGLAVQAYQRRATDVIGFLRSISGDVGRRIPVRLVKGAYWDTEIKRGQEQGLPGYPVFTRKSHTDISYLACARQLLDAGDLLYPQFATHNAHTLASIMHFARGNGSLFEFQRLHGMGEDLYRQVIDPEKFNLPCRVYAPVGSHEDLLPYLVRRLLENGANTSFVNRIVDENVEVADIIADPVALASKTDFRPHPRIPAPADLFQPERRNSRGFNLADRSVIRDLLDAVGKAAGKEQSAAPLVSGEALPGREVRSVNPANTKHVIGTWKTADSETVDKAAGIASAAQIRWDRRPAAERSEILQRAARLFELNTPELLALCIHEAGKTLPDAVAEVREAVDFLRYYAAGSVTLFGDPTVLRGPTGEKNSLGMRGRGVFVCISPWNFPLAIFTGQVAAALAAGNAVLAKPAEQTTLVAARATQLLLEAGVPPDVLHFIPGDGATTGAHAVADPRIAGVAFTGSTETARSINRTLAARDGPIAVLIAETGGQNAMFVDSSALPEQVVLDSVLSAFNSAGQRCSALRILCLQREIAPRVIELLRGHMQELVVGDPADLATDVGPVIDDEAKAMLSSHVEKLRGGGKLIQESLLPSGASRGTWFPPTAIEIDSIDVLEREVFGPVLHVLRFPGRRLAETVAAVNRTGYGLTMGLHSRIDSRARSIIRDSGAGNIYINRNMIGAVVGVQPFGGRGLSGTGPKAGGPHYLSRFGIEYSVSNNISAVGGNASLLSLNDDEH